jgi:hypothetical protein
MLADVATVAAQRPRRTLRAAAPEAILSPLVAAKDDAAELRETMADLPWSRSLLGSPCWRSTAPASADHRPWAEGNVVLRPRAAPAHRWRRVARRSYPAGSSESSSRAR